MNLTDAIWNGFAAIFLTIGFVTVWCIGWFVYLVMRDIVVPGYRRIKRLFVNI